MYVLSYRGPNFSEVTVTKVESQEQADALIAGLPSDGSYCGIKVADQNSLRIANMSVSLLTTLYNTLAETPIKKFENAETARVRLFQQIQRAAKPVEPVQLEPQPDEPTPTQVDIVEGAALPEGGDSKPDSDTSLEPGSEPESEEEMAKKKAAKKAARKAKPKGERKPRKGAIPLDGKIKLLADKNPRREGTKAFKSIDLIRDGMLVSTYLDKGGKLGFLQTEIKKGRAKIV